MEVVCENCKNKLNIPDEKVARIPKGQSVQVGCPKCKNKITVKGKQAQSSDSSPKKPQPKKAKPDPGDGAVTADLPEDKDSLMNELDFLEEGVETAMICESDKKVIQSVQKILKDMQYHVVVPAAPREALKQMRVHDFNVVVINERFGTTDPDMNHVLRHIEQLMMDRRRGMFVVLLTERFNTMDYMMAFNKSVNIIYNLKDLDNFEKYFPKGISEFKAMYKVFNEELKNIQG